VARGPAPAPRGGRRPGGPALVLRLDEGRVLRLDPEAKVAVEIDAARLRARAHGDASLAASLMGSEDALRTAPIEGRRTIAGHPCRGFRLRGRQTSVDVWGWRRTCRPGPASSRTSLEWSGAAPGPRGPSWPRCGELPGFPLETRTRVSVLGETQETVATVTKVQVGPQPAALFEVPAGWRLETENP